MTQFQRACIHEAGHSVMALLVGASVEHVSVVPRGLASCRTVVGAVPSAWAHVMIAAAGLVAEEIEFGYLRQERDADEIMVRDKCGGVQYDEFQCAARWVLKMHWKSVKRVAEALSTRYILSGDELRGVVGAMVPNVYESP